MRYGCKGVSTILGTLVNLKLFQIKKIFLKNKKMVLIIHYSSFHSRTLGCVWDSNSPEVKVVACQEVRKRLRGSGFYLDFFSFFSKETFFFSFQNGVSERDNYTIAGNKVLNVFWTICMVGGGEVILLLYPSVRYSLPGSWKKPRELSIEQY